MNQNLVDKLNALRPNTLMETLSIEYIEVDIEKGIVKATMPINSKVHQPLGSLHGGASASLAESLGSAASWLFIDTSKQGVLGVDISANHLRRKSDGFVTGIASLVHKGKKTHLWQIRIEDEEGKLICLCKITNMVIELKS